MASIDFARKSTLVGELVSLQPAGRADVPVLHAAMADVELSKLTGSIHTLAEADEQPWTVADLEEIYTRWSIATDRIVWVIVENSSATVVGEAAVTNLDPGNRSCGFRIWIAGARDRGLGTEAVRLAMRHVFEDQGLHRVELEVYDFNPRARHVYEKVGFVHEGTKRAALLFEDEWVDAHLMSILAGEWAEHHGAPGPVRTNPAGRTRPS